MRYVKILFLFLAASSNISCKKSIKETLAEKYFSENVLNRDFEITYAKNEGEDITSTYLGYSFLLKKGSDFYNGPLIVTKGTDIYYGTWQADEDFGKLTIVLPSLPAEFAFLTRDWRFTSKKLPVLKFAPWGSDAKIALTMERK